MTMGQGWSELPRREWGKYSARDTHFVRVDNWNFLRKLPQHSRGDNGGKYLRQDWTIQRRESAADAIMGNGMKIGLSSSQRSDTGVSTMENFLTSLKLFHEPPWLPINLVSAIEIFQAWQLLPALRIKFDLTIYRNSCKTPIRFLGRKSQWIRELFS